MEVKGTNYLIPVDAKLTSEHDLGFETISADEVMSTMSGARALRVLILDACRDNPFAATMQLTDKTRAVSRGLARIEQPTDGSLIVYSARPGQLALDGDGPNSPFASALARRLTEPNVEILKLFRLVRDDVLALTNQQQQVFEDNSLPAKDFFFKQ
jgi:uncharacterized caspase-like protein